MAKDVTLVYDGPQVLVVELGEELEDGGEVTVDPGLAEKLLMVGGFREKGKKAPTPPEAKLATRAVLEERATVLGLQIYPTEPDAGLADRIRSHGGSSEPGEPEPEPAPTPPAGGGDE